MKDFLEQLNISSHNHGMSTGQHWLGSSGPSIVSVSPVDGQPIASVFTADRASYEAESAKQKRHLLNGENGLHQNAETLYVR